VISAFMIPAKRLFRKRSDAFVTIEKSRKNESPCPY